MNKTKLIIRERFNGKQTLEDVFWTLRKPMKGSNSFHWFFCKRSDLQR